MTHPASPDKGSVSTLADDKLHAAVCQAVAIINTSLDMARSADGRQVSQILRQALIDYADDLMDQPTTEAEQVAMRKLHKGRTK